MDLANLDKEADCSWEAAVRDSAVQVLERHNKVGHEDSVVVELHNTWTVFLADVVEVPDRQGMAEDVVAEYQHLQPTARSVDSTEAVSLVDLMPRDFERTAIEPFEQYQLLGIHAP